MCVAKLSKSVIAFTICTHLTTTWLSLQLSHRGDHNPFRLLPLQPFSSSLPAPFQSAPPFHPFPPFPPTPSSINNQLMSAVSHCTRYTCRFLYYSLSTYAPDSYPAVRHMIYARHIHYVGTTVSNEFRVTKATKIYVGILLSNTESSVRINEAIKNTCNFSNTHKIPWAKSETANNELITLELRDLELWNLCIFYG